MSSNKLYSMLEPKSFESIIESNDNAKGLSIFLMRN